MTEPTEIIEIVPTETNTFLSRNVKYVVDKFTQMKNSMASDMTSLSINIYILSFITLYFFVGIYSGCFVKNIYKLGKLLLPWYFPIAKKPTIKPTPKIKTQPPIKRPFFYDKNQKFKLKNKRYYKK